MLTRAGKPERVEIAFEGRNLPARRGETVASALTAAGIRAFRTTLKGEPRGLFCGMGVCQECLVEIDGRPSGRACMTKIEGPMHVRRQTSPAALLHRQPGPHASTGSAREPRPEPVEGRHQPLPIEPDILVVGGGAGGLAAAATAARSGAQVLLVDERPAPGGQFFKQPVFERPDDRQYAGGRALIREAEAAGVRFLPGALVWGAFPPLDLMILQAGATLVARPKRLVVATGAYERGLPVPGWTLPGVMTTGAAQTLLRSYGLLPGKRVLVAGSGPLNLQVALELARAGAEVAAVAELSRPGGGAAGAIARMAASSPSLLVQGGRLLAGLTRRRIPLYRGHVLTRVERSGEALTATLAPWPGTGGPIHGIEVEAVCMGYGLLPSNDLLRATDCRHEFDAARGQLVTVRDAHCRTTVESVYAVGDCAGLGGARAAVAEGRIAGAAAARSLGFAAPDPEDQRRELARHRRFQGALWELFGAKFPGLGMATPDTVVCRCEELTLSDIEAGLELGPRGVGSLKRLTRAGMGACQGRYCGPLLAALIEERTGKPTDGLSFWAPRPPVKPVSIGEVGGGRE